MNPFEFHAWFPRGVKRVIDSGASNFIGMYDDNTVLKYPLVSPNDNGEYDDRGRKYRNDFREHALQGLHVEGEILRKLGEHPRIIRLQQSHEAGILLEYMPNGSVGRYIRDIAPTTSLQQRLKWVSQAAEALAYVHSKNILHCDMSIGNLLLDANLDIKLSDFQGRLLSPDGTILLDGGAGQGALSSMPRDDEDYCDIKTDIFALGTTAFFIITGHLPFTELDPLEDEDEIQQRFKDGDLPPLEQYQGGNIIHNCWRGNYKLAGEMVQDLQDLQERLEVESNSEASQE